MLVAFSCDNLIVFLFMTFWQRRDYKRMAAQTMRNENCVAVCGILNILVAESREIAVVMKDIRMKRAVEKVRAVPRELWHGYRK